MPKIILKSTGREMTVTAEGLAKIKANPEMERLYKYPKDAPPAEEPEEVSNLRTRKQKALKPGPEALVETEESKVEESKSKD